MMTTAQARLRRMQEALRWLVSLLTAAALHIALIACYYYNKQTSKELTLAAPAAPIVLDLAPLPVTSRPASVESLATNAAKSKVVVKQTQGIAEVPVKEVVKATVKVVVKEKEIAKPDKALSDLAEMTKSEKYTPTKTTKEQVEEVSEARQSRPDNSSEQKAEKNQAPQIGAANASQSQLKADWESQLLAKLQQAKRYPANAIRNKQEDLVLVHFVIDGDGKVLSVDIIQSRGYELLERESLALLKRVSPLPKPPANLIEGKQRLEMVVPIEFLIKQAT